MHQLRLLLAGFAMLLLTGVPAPRHKQVEPEHIQAEVSQVGDWELDAVMLLARLAVGKLELESWCWNDGVSMCSIELMQNAASCSMLHNSEPDSALAVHWLHTMLITCRNAER